MKSNIEKNIKESLQNHEMPYNASAWTAMQAKLDVIKPVSVAAPASNLKWIIVAASVAVVGVVSYLAVTSNSTPSQKEQVKAQSNEVVESNIPTPNNNTQKDDKLESNLTSTPSNSETNNSNSSNTSENNRNYSADRKVNDVVNNSTNNSVTSNNTSNYRTNESNALNGSNNANNNNGINNPTSVNKSYELPVIESVCEGDVVTINNTNDVAIVVDGPELHFIIPAKSERKVRLKANGNHSISIMGGEKTEKKSSFIVKNAPKADFIIDTDTKFEKGLPTTKLETSVPGVEHTWIIGKSRVYGEKVEAHFYKAGNQDITLTIKDINGCTNSITKSIHVDEKYNLMAVNSFIPEDIDARNNTFMPFALTQRDVKFNLMIIDPTDGHTVFQSNDASNAWNGIDRTTGNPVNYGTTYIWKVTIENAQPNENNEYAGNITPIRKR